MFLLAGVFIAGTGCYLPAQKVTNDDLAKIVDTSDEWIRERTGIRERRFSSGEPTWYMACHAAEECLANAKASAEEVDLIIACTLTPDFSTPSLACVVQSEIGAKNAFCWDMNAACSAFIFALDAAHKYLACGEVKNVLIVCSELLSKMTDFTDRSTCVLFGDGAAAVLVRRDDSRPFASALESDGASGGALLARNHPNKSPYATDTDNELYQKYPATKDIYLAMAGREVYRFATRAMSETLRSACAKAGITPAELDLVVPHQANIRIIKTAAESLGIGMDKMCITLDRYGNTSCSSIPICLDEIHRAGRIKRGMKVAFSGFGGGLTSGSIVTVW